jgi:hypothetical protein
MAASATAPSSLSSFVKQFMQQLFPKDQYGKDKEAVFHTIVAHQANPSNALNKWEKTAQKYGADYYHKQKSPMQMTPLHVAAMKGDFVALEFFLKHNPLLESQDSRGWTPAHHAAARGDRALLELMQGAGGVGLMHIRNQWGSTPQDFLRMQEFPEFADESVVCQILEGDTVRDCTSREFREITKANFTDRVIATTDGLYSDWRCLPRVPVPLTCEIQRTFVLPHLLDPRPRLLLRRTESLGYEVTTLEEIPQGTVLGEYTGELVPSREYHISRNTDYLFEQISGERWRNLLPILNDGPPNATYSEVFNHEGFPRRIMLIALRTIKPGEPITFDYGHFHDIKWGLYHISDEQRDATLRLWKGMLEHPESQTEGSALELQLYKALNFYVLSTPEILLRIVLDDPSYNLEAIIREHGESGYGMGDFYIKAACQLIKSGREFAKILAALDPESKKWLTDLAFKLIHRYERLFAHLVLGFLKLSVQKMEVFFHKYKSQPQVLLQFEEEMGKMCAELVLAECQRINQARRELSESGVTLGSFPVDLDAVIQRLS